MEMNQINEYLWEIPPSEKKGMRVPARIYTSPSLIQGLDEGVFDQITNVASLPGIIKYALCMPDGHWGYGFPIGGVAAFSIQEGIISPGGIGFDINCGMRLIRTNLTLEAVRPHIRRLVEDLFKAVPSGVGGKGFARLTRADMEDVMVEGAQWCVRKGYGRLQDLERIEAEGRIAWADPSAVSDRAVERGIGQLGTLGSGNH
ncbi:MAG: RtcB family protein, partial [Nitrospiria bacterium]